MKLAMSFSDAIRSLREAAVKVLEKEKSSLSQALGLESPIPSLVSDPTACVIRSSPTKGMEALLSADELTGIAFTPRGTPTISEPAHLVEQSDMDLLVPNLSEQEPGIVSALEEKLAALETTNLKSLEEIRQWKDQASNQRSMTTALVGQVQQLMKEKEQDSTTTKEQIDCLEKKLNIALSDNVSLKNEVHRAKRNNENQDRLKRQVESLQESLKDKDNKLKSTKEVLNKKKNDLVSTKKVLNKKKNELKSTKKALLSLEKKIALLGLGIVLLRPALILLLPSALAPAAWGSSFLGGILLLLQHIDKEKAQRNASLCRFGLEWFCWSIGCVLFLHLPGTMEALQSLAKERANSVFGFD